MSTLHTSLDANTPKQPLSRRAFVARTTMAAGGMTVLGSALPALGDTALSSCPVVVFSKVYQELHLNFEDAAALTAEAGLNGVDPPVRPGGEVLPGRVDDDLPRYAESLKKRGLSIPLLTTAITSTSTPYAEKVLRAAKQVGAQSYRLGFFDRRKDRSSAEQVREIRDQLKDVLAMSHQIGILPLFQNHSSSGRADNIGGDLAELHDVLDGFEPSQIGAAFDIGHALIIHGNEWEAHFRRLKPFIKVAYIKDAKIGGGFVRFGEGAISKTDYFQQLRGMEYHAPFSLHVEFDWSNGGSNKNRETLVKALRESCSTLRSWMGQA